MSFDPPPTATQQASPESASAAAAPVGVTPDEIVRELQRERDHLLVLHESLAAAERAASLTDKLRVLATAMQRVGFGRVIITLCDAGMETTAVVATGLSDEEQRTLCDQQVDGAVWRRRLASIERFRISASFYLDGRDPGVVAEFGEGLPSRRVASEHPDWSPRDALLVPLHGAHDEVVAIMRLDEPEDHARPTLARVRTIELFGRQAAAMLQQAALRTIADRRAERLQLLQEAGSLLARSLDEETIVRTLASEATRVLRAVSATVFTVDDAGRLAPRAIRPEQRAAPAAEDALHSLAARTVSTRRVTYDEPRRLVAVPAVLAGSLLAVIALELGPGTPVDTDDADLLATIGAQAASALSNARAYAESQRQRRQTEALADVARAVGESRRLDQVVRLILRHASALLRAEGSCVSVVRSEELEVIAGLGGGENLVGLRMPLAGSISGRVVRTGESIVGDVADGADAASPMIVRARVRNLVMVPLSSDHGPIGVLSVFNRDEQFTAGDAEVLHRLADQVSVAMVNARLFEEAADATREWSVAFDATGSGMALLDAGGRITRSNARARELMGGRTEPEVVGRALHDALFGDDEPCERCVHLAAIQAREVRRGTHAHAGRGRLFELTAAPHPSGGAVVTFDDVTEHRALAERYRLVVETSSDAIVITDRERRIAFANPAAHALFGYGADLIGLPVARTAPMEVRDRVRDHEDAVFAGASQQYETIILRSDDERRIVAVSSAPLREMGTVSGTVASLRDITEQRRARDAVSASETRYRNLFDSASDSIYTLDGRGAFTSVNEATEQMTGRSQGELLGHSARLLIAEDELAYVGEQFRRAFSGVPVRYECHFHRADGESRLVSVNNTPIRRGAEVIGVLGVARDVTDERAHAAALERSEARYTRLVESASDAIFTIDQRGYFTAVNRALETAVGRTRHDLVGRPFAELVDARDLADAERLLLHTYAGERRRGALRYRAADGEARHGSVITAPVYEEGLIVGALGIMRDVTDERRLAEQVMQQEKLAAMGQLVSGVAHELNNPLAGVMAYAELLRLLPSTDPESLLAVETIHREAQRAAKIVRHLLTFARQQPSERIATDVNAVIADTVALRESALRTAHIAVDLALDPALPPTWADPFQLQQVILNLLTNAEQALADRPHPRRIAVRSSHSADRIVVTLSDSGPGIPPQHLDRIFNPFFTTKPVGQGTGLGLSISDGIVREHGGRIRAESSAGEGATFIVELPVVPVPEAAAAVSGVAPLAAVVGRLLVVDDEAAMRSAISNFLRSVGHAVDVAATVGEARAMLGANEYDVVLLDLRMPDARGDTLFTELQVRDPRHADRVVFVTGDMQNERVQQFLATAGRPVVHKPFQLDDLAARVAAAMP